MRNEVRMAVLLVGLPLMTLGTWVGGWIGFAIGVTIAC